MSTAAGANLDTALGYAEATDLFGSFPAAFAGQSVDSTAILIKHTFYGDVNLDGGVALDDFNRLAGNFGATSARWSQGNMDYDLDVDLDDFNLLATNFGTSVGPDAPRATSGSFTFSRGPSRILDARRASSILDTEADVLV